jgi:crossover junction endodeoxyribonuclease RusA
MNMNHVTLTLPVPSPMLSPNARPHYMAKAKVTKQHRQAAKLVAMGALNRDEPRWARASVQLAWTFTDARKRDQDNLLARCKAYFDGLRDAGLIDDDSGLTHLPMTIEKGDEAKLVMTVRRTG